MIESLYGPASSASGKSCLPSQRAAVFFSEKLLKVRASSPLHSACDIASTPAHISAISRGGVSLTERIGDVMSVDCCSSCARGRLSHAVSNLSSFAASCWSRSGWPPLWAPTAVAAGPCWWGVSAKGSPWLNAPCLPHGCLRGWTCLSKPVVFSPRGDAFRAPLSPYDAGPLSASVGDGTGTGVSLLLRAGPLEILLVWGVVIGVDRWVSGSLAGWGSKRRCLGDLLPERMS